MLLLSFLIDCFQAVFPHPLSRLLFLSEHSLYLFLNTLNEEEIQQGFFLSAVCFEDSLLHDITTFFSQDTFFNKWDSQCSHWDAFQPSHLALYLPESLILPFTACSSKQVQMKEEKVLKSDNEGGSSYCFTNYKHQKIFRKVGKVKMKKCVRMKKVMNCPWVYPVAKFFPCWVSACYITLISLDDQMSWRII